MARVKHTKTELKAQSDALKRYQRFLPMLQLKKQQLQMEIAAISAQVEALRGREQAQQQALASWVALFAGEGLPDDLVVLTGITTDSGNIAGVQIPLFRGIQTRRATLDLFATPSWFDDAQDAVAALLALRAEAAVLLLQRDRVALELRVTAQRVNLFEKVKIPQCRENIREIRIFLGDEQTAGVSRGKIAKRRGVKQERAA